MAIEKQHTIIGPVTVKGIGLHTGVLVNMTFHPAPENHGKVFRRIDLEGQPLVHADVDNVIDTSRGTTLSENGVKVNTVEHTLAALAGLQIDNVLIDLDGPEPPIMDGSARVFIDSLRSIGLKEQDAERVFFVVEEAFHYSEPDRKVEITLVPGNSFQATTLVDFDSNILKPQYASLDSLDKFPDEFGGARTFCFVHELESLHNAGLIKGGSLESAVVIMDQELQEEELKRLTVIFGKPEREIREGILNQGGFRYENEPARHKLLDLIGDLALVGMPIKGHIIATRPGHKANIALARKIKSRIRQKRISERFMKGEKKGVVLDINAIQEVLPHRYPFLLVDKVIEFTENTIRGIKNVTVNEPFFQGHFPGNPIMPGVLQLEAMGQLGGILLLNTIEDPKSIWVYFVAIDNARFKKPVIPGDVLELELEMTALRRSICKMSGKAFVDGNLVCSADLVASVVPKSKL